MSNIIFNKLIDGIEVDKVNSRLIYGSHINLGTVLCVFNPSEYKFDLGRVYVYSGLNTTLGLDNLYNLLSLDVNTLNVITHEILFQNLIESFIALPSNSEIDISDINSMIYQIRRDRIINQILDI